MRNLLILSLYFGFTAAWAAAAPADLMQQAQAAETAKDWPKAEALLTQLTTQDPQHWEYRQELADVQLNQGKYTEAADSYATALVSAGKAKLTPAIRQAMTLMYTNEGNAYLRLKRDDDAMKAYTQAAEITNDPAVPWFNLCALQYNMGKTEAALTACDKAIAADPKKADAYFVKGSILVGDSTVDKAGKITTPPGALEALKKYLALAPNGSHAADVRQMLDYLNGKN